MAANKFATTLHRSTNRITVILVYAVLEWTLILLLLLNSLFSHLIVRFAEFFGLKPPCPWCARLENVFRRSKASALRDLLCEAHSKEVSRLGFCSNHRKLVELRDMCEDCLSSDFEGFCGILRENEGVGKVGETTGDLGLKKCSCCGVVRLLGCSNRGDVCNETLPWDVLECDEKEDSMITNHHVEKTSEFSGNFCDKSVQVCVDHEESSPQHLEFFLDYTGHKLVPIEIVDDFITEDDDKIEDGKDEEKQEDSMLENRFLDDIDINVVPEDSILMEIDEDEDSLPFHCNSMIVTEDEEVHEADVSIGTEIPDIEIIPDETHNHNHNQQPSTSLYNAHEPENHGTARDEEHSEEIEPTTVQETDQRTKNEEEKEEEDKAPDTPTSTDGDKKLLLLEKRPDYPVPELESLDGGSIASDLENWDGGVITVESLKSALRTERKALQELYAELEEERSASAVAANQTMAMINRLQEEKAAVQMEALQYQRMMEEQSEYDQEALQLLNELMVKREKEKQELERELEACRKRISEYETKEKMWAVGKSKEGISCGSGSASSGAYSNPEDSDGVSIDSETKEEEEEEEEEGFAGTPVGAVLDLEESLADFEDERVSILEQLKALEEKLFSLEDGTQRDFEDVRTIDDADFGRENDVETNGHHVQVRKITDQNGKKSLLPLFDAIDHEENGDGFHDYGNGDYHEDDGFESKFEDGNKKLAIEEEVDHLYERLQALEADREFLKHCVGSLKKGDKGMELLKEILQHLRSLRNVELRVRGVQTANKL